SRRFRKISGRIQDSMGDVTHVGEEVISGHRIVKVFGGEQYEREHFATINEHNTRLNIRLARTRAASTPIVQFVTSWVIAAIIFFSTRPSMLAMITPGTFVAFLGAMMALNTPLKQITMINATLQKGIAAAANIFELLSQPIEPQGGDVALKRATGAIRFDGLSFVYPKTDR